MAPGHAWQLVFALLAMQASPDEVAAEHGSALLALPPPTGAEDERPLNQQPQLQLSVGLRTLDGIFCKLLERGQPLPARATKLFTTVEDSQPVARLEVWAGERPFCPGNMLLGSVSLAPLPVPSYRSFVQIEVVLDASADGALVLTAAEVENRALGESFAQVEWRGHVLEAEAAPGSTCAGGDVVPFSHALAKHLPVLLATRTVRLHGRDIVVRQHQRREEERVGTGGVLWEAAIALADHVGRRRGSAWQGRRVLELGAGTGLVAIALALEGARVLATDGNPRVVEGARRNVLAAGAFEPPGAVDLEVFDWNSAQDLARVQGAGPWDAVVGSDLVYPGNAGRKCVESNDTKPPADVTLLGLFEALASPSTEILLALKDRTGEVGRFMEVAEASGWTVHRASPEELLPDFRDMPSLAMLGLIRGTSAGDTTGASP